MTLLGFNPRPPLLAGDALPSSMDDIAPYMFQSAPAIAGGRCVDEGSSLTVRGVSIRARHCWRAMQRIESCEP